MAGRTKSAVAKHAYRLFAPASGATVPNSADEFDESDIWGSANPADPARTRPIPAARPARVKGSDRSAAAARTHGSVPVNIPDWSKILGGEYREPRAGEWELDDGEWEVDDGEPGAGGALVPPHELVCRGRAASLSVHEGIGRTLKGRDLSRVRDAVWKKTGFED